VRIRENNDRLQVAVNRATLFTDSFEPAMVLPDPTRDATPTRREYYRKNGNGNGTGSGKNGGNNGKYGSGTPPSQPQLRIVLDETDDEDDDTKRLSAVFSALNDFTGGDRVRLSVRQLDGKEVDIPMPVKVRQCDDLTRLLSNIVGPWGSVYA
jgi:hypothetical protein